MSRAMRARLAATMCVAALGTVVVPQPAEACGGLFCSGANPIAVEQNAERILFVKEQGGRYSAYVEIKYAGDPKAFSWVVPVAETPELGVVSPSTLQVVDLLTRPTIIAPPLQCGDPLRSSGGLACGGAPLSAGEADRGVTVENLPRVGPYEPKVISSEDPTALYDWLNANGYLLTPEMRPFIEGYSKKKMKFLAMRLAPDAQVADIQPLKMTYATPCPFVPLSLTAVSAEPEMSVLVLFLGEGRMRSTNYRNLTIPAEDVRMDARRRDNYYALVSRRIDEAGGRAFVTELAGRTSALKDPNTVFLSTPDAAAAQEEARTLLAQSGYVTRLYARLSAWEMTLDPEFEASDDGDVSNVFDLSGRPALETCGDSPGVTCGDTYCGEGAKCGVNKDGLEGCVCPDGFVARPVTLPDLRLGSRAGVMCQKSAFSVLMSVSLLGPCTSLGCGTGRCVVTNGFATCACPAGQLARVDGLQAPGNTGGSVKSLACEPAVESYGPARLTWLEAGSGCAVGPALPWTVLGVLGVLALRRRRRRS